ncbi:MAG TPA: DUF998 domain-containing protein [Stackebrandtia sp.]|uniref:DUF998 domain-containing protein n=1 Tax=Stackebrandtia sp. TaxID=2023065 RepID=UPI002D3CCC60|nr:DUF998 domain-containing protein [Stackebrandtia sp.]HZE38679.1 DUF998 domain-containing protein [Stackebrandtia sp.]
MNDTTDRQGEFDTPAAVTRSMLGWGVVAGVFYLVVGIVLGLTRDGFDFGEHQLSLLMLGHLGWAQATNLILSGAMAAVAGWGFIRAMRPSRAAGWGGGLVAAYGACLIVGGSFPPDPMGGFPPGAKATGPSAHGMVHLASGGIGFLLIASAALVVAAWQARNGARGWAAYSRLSAVVVIVGFLGGAALSSNLAGIVGLWATVVVAWAWLAATSVHLYRTVPRPDRFLR